MHLKEVLYHLQNLLKQSTSPQAGGWERGGRAWAHEPQFLPVIESHKVHLERTEGFQILLFNTLVNKLLSFSNAQHKRTQPWRSVLLLMLYLVASGQCCLFFFFFGSRFELIVSFKWQKWNILFHITVYFSNCIFMFLFSGKNPHNMSVLTFCSK